MNSTKRMRIGFNALSDLSNPKNSPTVYYALNAAIREACDRKQFETAASLRDLRETLTNNWKPEPTPADELRAAAGV